MICDVISTGATKGNAVLLNGAYLFDCGVPFFSLKPYMDDISVVFLTHRHSDHFNRAAIRRLHRRKPLIRFVCAKNLIVPLVAEAGVSLDNVILVTEQTREIPGANGETLRVSAFPLVHDVENVGYIVSVNGGEQDGTAMYATDTHHIPISAPGLDLYMVEANYTKEDMDRRIAAKAEAGAFSYEGRVMASHMSMETAVEWLRENADQYKSKIVFLHGHIDRKENEAE